MPNILKPEDIDIFDGDYDDSDKDLFKWCQAWLAEKLNNENVELWEYVEATVDYSDDKKAVLIAFANPDEEDPERWIDEEIIPISESEFNKLDKVIPFDFVPIYIRISEKFNQAIA